MSGTLVARPGAGKELLGAKVHDTSSEPFVPYQDPLAVRLDGPTILLTLVSILTAHFLSPLFTKLLIAASAALLLIHHDYHNFLNLGRGGVPSTFRGYLTITWLRLFALRDPFSPPPIDPTCNPRHGILPRHNLPRRQGLRPKVAGIIPHRQLDQRGAEGPYFSLRTTLQTLAAAYPDTLATARSCFEKHGLGLFAQRPINETCRGEILHVHESDRAMHMNLHPEDITAVLEAGWGQRHPLARRHMHVKETFVLIYAPRDEHELRVVCQIVEAAVWFVAGERTSIKVT